MKLTTNIRPEDVVSIDNEGEYLVLNVQPNRFGGSDSVTYLDGDDEFVVQASRCAVIREPRND